MATPDVESTLAELRPGDRVTLRLQNGDEISGPFASKDGDVVTLEDADEGVTADQIESVVLEISSPGPE